MPNGPDASVMVDKFTNDFAPFLAEAKEGYRQQLPLVEGVDQLQ